MSSRASSALLVAGCCLVSAQQQQPEQQHAVPRTSAGLPGGLRNLENIRRKRVLTTRLEAQEQARQRRAAADNGSTLADQAQQQPQQTTQSIYSAEDADAFFAESNFFDLRHLQKSMDTDAPTADESTPAPTPVDCNSDPDVREAAVAELLSSVSDDANDPSTPAGQAAEWILSGDPAMPDPCRDPDAVVGRFALTTFYYSTGGEQWRNNDGWLSEAPACDWFGVGCDGDNIVELNMGASR